MIDKIRKFTSLSFWSHRYTTLGLWILLAIIASLLKLNSHNNFLVFRSAFIHAWQGLDMYAAYPLEYSDYMYYGPLFSIVVAPFAIVPEWVGLFMWQLALTLFLWWAISKSTLKKSYQIFILWFCAHELLTALFMMQFNIAVCALIVLSYAFVAKGKDHWATLCIVVGVLIKLYGIVGIAFFFFSSHKKKFACWLAIWAAVCFALPMLISSPQYVCQQYGRWLESLSGKDEANLFAPHQNVSLLGMIRRIGYGLSQGHQALLDVENAANELDVNPNIAIPLNRNCWAATYSDVWILLGAFLLMCVTYFRMGWWKTFNALQQQWNQKAFQYAILASVLMVVCLFSSGSESSSYIIAMTGAAIWYLTAPWKRSKTDMFLMWLVFIVTSLSVSDIMPLEWRRHFFKPYSIKALPIALVWLKLNYELITRNYNASVAEATVSNTSK